jgi:hypothetical protein
MRDFPWGARRYKRDWLRGREIAYRDLRNSPYPTPEQMFFSIASLILAAFLLGVAADFLIGAFSN